MNQLWLHKILLRVEIIFNDNEQTFFIFSTMSNTCRLLHVGAQSHSVIDQFYEFQKKIIGQVENLVSHDR